MGRKKSGDRVNLENDMIAKYVEKFVHAREDRGERSLELITLSSPNMVLSNNGAKRYASQFHR